VNKRIKVNFSAESTKVKTPTFIQEFSHFSSGSPGSLIRALHGIEVALCCKFCFSYAGVVCVV
jgi:hypothetical protein